MNDDVQFDWQRTLRNGIPEVVYAEGKSVSQLLSIGAQALSKKQRILMTRVEPAQAVAMTEKFGQLVDWQEQARTLTVGSVEDTKLLRTVPCVAIVAAGTSDHGLVCEIEQCLGFLGARSQRYVDVGVAGLWRLTDIADELRSYPVVVAIAGMEGALFSVLAGLIDSPVIAVPSSVGYGVTAGGHAALNCALGSCAPGIAVVNIDNGFGAAALALKMLGVSMAKSISNETVG